MKNITKWMVLPAILATLFWSCKKDENKDYYTGGTAPMLTASDTSLHIAAANKANTSVTFSWTNPNYQFTTGISSQNVNYVLQIDTLGSNFTNPNMFTVAIASNLSKTFGVDELNSDLSNAMGLATGVSHTIQVRLASSLGTANGALLYSNVLQYTVTPYAPPPLVAPPSSGKLFLVGGDPLIGAWSNPVPTSQQFTQVSATEYKITVKLSGGDPTNSSNQFLILPVNGDWTNKYACVAASATSTGGTFGYNLSDNFPGPLVAGTYLIDVNFQIGKYTVTKQ